MKVYNAVITPLETNTRIFLLDFFKKILSKRQDTFVSYNNVINNNILKIKINKLRFD